MRKTPQRPSLERTTYNKVVGGRWVTGIKKNLIRWITRDVRVRVILAKEKKPLVGSRLGLSSAKRNNFRDVRPSRRSTVIIPDGESLRTGAGEERERGGQ